MINADQMLTLTKLVFAKGTPARDWLEEQALDYAHPFDKDPYRTAFNLGAQDLINRTRNMADE